MLKKNILVLFNENTAEAAANIIACIRKEDYEAVVVGLTEKGRWLCYPYLDSISEIIDGTWEYNPDVIPAILSPDNFHKGILKFEGKEVFLKKIDVIFPLVSENAAIHGLLQLSKIPYIGSDLTTVVSCSDIAYTLAILEHSNVKTLKWKIISSRKMQELDSECANISENLKFPMVVRPVDNSEICTVANDLETLKSHIKIAFSYARKIIVEEYPEGREVQVAVIDYEGCPIVSLVQDKNTKEIIYESYTNTVKEITAHIYRTLGCTSYAMIKFLVAETGIFVDDVNVLPDLSEKGDYALLMKAMGIEYNYLVQKLIETTLDN